MNTVRNVSVGKYCFWDIHDEWAFPGLEAALLLIRFLSFLPTLRMMEEEAAAVSSPAAAAPSGWIPVGKTDTTVGDKVTLLHMCTLDHMVAHWCHKAGHKVLPQVAADDKGMRTGLRPMCFHVELCIYARCVNPIAVQVFFFFFSSFIYSMGTV